MAAGWRVVVPFGSSDTEGFVLEIRESVSNDEMPSLKSIRDVPDDEPWFDEEMLETAKWLSEYYVCSLGEALRLFIPGKSGVKSEKFYQISPDSESVGNLGAVYDFIRQKGKVSFMRLRMEFGAVCRTGKSSRHSTDPNLHARLPDSRLLTGAPFQT